MNTSTVSGVCIALVAVIHLLPGLGVLGVDRLTSLYGINTAEANLQVLMRHRAVLFALLGAFMMASAFYAPWRLPAYGFAFLSVLSFLWLAWSVGGVNAQLSRVVWVDWIALALLVLGAGMELFKNLNGGGS